MKQMQISKRDKANSSAARGGRKLIFMMSTELEGMVGTIRVLATPSIITASDAIRLAIRVLAQRLRDEQADIDARDIADMDARILGRNTDAAPAVVAPWDDPNVSPADLAELPDDSVAADPGL